MEQVHVLRNGERIPHIGVGTYKLKEESDLSHVLEAAIGQGYRLIDTAAVYKNESLIRQILDQICPSHGLAESELYITTKLAPVHQGYEKTMAAVQKSSRLLGRQVLDMYLIHWPGTRGLKREDPENAILREGSWKALEEICKGGKVKSVGVSNFTLRHLKEMEKYATIIPHMLQSECHPALPQQDVRAYCKENGIYFQAYSSLGCGKLLSNEEVIRTAARYQKTPAQILLKWASQQEIGIIPKASSAERIRENCNIFDFEMSVEDLKRMEMSAPSHHYCWNPENVA